MSRLVFLAFDSKRAELAAAQCSHKIHVYLLVSRFGPEWMRPLEWWTVPCNVAINEQFHMRAESEYIYKCSWMPFIYDGHYWLVNKMYVFCAFLFSSTFTLSLTPSPRSLRRLRTIPCSSGNTVAVVSAPVPRNISEHCGIKRRQTFGSPIQCVWTCVRSGPRCAPTHAMRRPAHAESAKNWRKKRKTIDAATASTHRHPNPIAMRSREQ